MVCLILMKYVSSVCCSLSTVSSRVATWVCMCLTLKPMHPVSMCPSRQLAGTSMEAEGGCVLIDVGVFVMPFFMGGDPEEQFAAPNNFIRN